MKALATAGLTLVLTLAASAAVAQDYTASLRNARVASPDNARTEALAKFYRDVFGQQEISRLALSEGRTEIIMNGGKTVEEAKANPGVRVLIITAADGVYPDPVSHLIFEVSNLDAALKAVAAHGGKALFRRKASAASNIDELAMITDPVGNKIEILVLKK